MVTESLRRRSGKLPCRLVIFCAAALLAGCATRMAPSEPAPSVEAANVQRPKRILVADFEVDPDAVRQDQGIGLRLQRSFSGGNQAAARDAIAADVQSAIAEALVEALSKTGLPTERAPPGAIYRRGDLVVTGRVLRIDEGNRTRRIGIGFGAGKSVVEAVAELSAVAPDGRQVLLQSDQGEADSGRKPGMGVGAAAAVGESDAAIGAVSAVTNLSGEARHTPVGKEAASYGRRLAREIGEYAAQRGWIAAASVPPWTR